MNIPNIQGTCKKGVHQIRSKIVYEYDFQFPLDIKNVIYGPTAIPVEGILKRDGAT